MSYIVLGALNEEQQKTVKAAVDELPSCYSNRFHRCYVNEEVNAFPNCQLFLDAYQIEGDAGEVETRVQKMSFCEEPNSSLWNMMFQPLPISLGFLAGYLIGKIK